MVSHGVVNITGDHRSLGVDDDIVYSDDSCTVDFDIDDILDEELEDLIIE